MKDLINQWEEKERFSQQNRKYLHFDQKTSINSAKKFVTNSTEIGRHYFYPFIKSDIDTKRFKKDKKTGERKFETKVRPIMYASHVDSMIYSYYNILLSDNYENQLKDKHFQSSILAYRKLGKSNIEFAYELFQEIKDMKECVVMAFDVSKFFDTLDHNILRSSWEIVLGSGLEYNKDHSNLFRALTKFAYVNKGDLEIEFKDELVKKDNKILYRYCSGKEFRERVRKKGLIHVNKNNFGIPQGSPISALLSNIYMLEFDKIVYKKVVLDNGGIYRRYCDDILLVCKTEIAKEIEEWIVSEIKNNFHLEIQEEKTEKYKMERIDVDGIYRPINISTGKKKTIQYLGFEFDGDHIFIRSSSMSRYYRRMKYRVHSAVYDAKKKGQKVFKKKLLLKNTEHATKIADNDFNKLSKKNPKLAASRKFRGNFITYAKRAASRMGEDKISIQIKPHRKILEQTIKEKDLIIKPTRRRDKRT